MSHRSSRLGGNENESCEVIAKEDVAATAFSGKFTRDTWLPQLGSATRIAEGFGKCGAALILGVSHCRAGLVQHSASSRHSGQN